MMEFVTSRVTLIICGAILMSALAVPMSQMFEEDINERTSEMTLKDAEAFDALMDSGYDEVYVRGSVFLPSSSFTMRIDGHVLTVTDDKGREYHAVVNNHVDDFRINYADTVIVTKTDDGGIEILDRI